MSDKGRLLMVSHMDCGEDCIRIISARLALRHERAALKKRRTTKTDDLRPSYDPALFKGAVRGKYYERYMAGTNLVLIQPDLFARFPSGEAVNDALRTLLRRKNRTRSTKNGAGQGRRKGIRARR